MDNKLGFCENKTIAKAIYSLLATEILGKEQYDKIVTLYKDMHNNFYNYPKKFATGERKEWVFSEGLMPFKPIGYDSYYLDTTAVPIPITHPTFIDLTMRKKGEGRGAIGLDFPTWFSQSDSAPFIMIIAQDPLRNAVWYGDKKSENFLCNEAVVSTPFGLQDAKYRERGNGGKRIWVLVQELLQFGYGVYLTDCRKYFVYSHEESNKYTTTEKVEKYKKILQKEIEIIKPVLIVTLGHSSTDYCRMLLGKDKRLSGYLPHLSGTANGAIKTFIKKNFGIEPQGAEQQAKLYARYIDKKVKEKD